MQRFSGERNARKPLFLCVRPQAFDRQGNLYIAEEDGPISRIVKFDSHGNFLTTWNRVPDHANPVTNCLTLDGQDNVYVVNTSQYRVEKYDSQEKLLTSWGSQGSGPGQFAEPDSIAIDAKGNIYVTDNRSNYRVEMFDGDGRFLAQWGGFGHGDGQFNAGGRIAVDHQGNVYVSDDGANDSVQKFRPR